MIMRYNLEMDRVIAKIKEEKARNILIQLPDGLKPKAELIQEKITAETNAEVFIWLGSCYGACDFPNVRDIDLLVSFGHSSWKY
jgi:diphthamide biosynthesis enzyme Dph1/Dph2-like protein